LPRASIPGICPGALREDALRFVLMRDGKLYLGGERIDTGELPDPVRDSVRGGAENRGYLLVGARIKCSEVKPVLNEIAQAGVRNRSSLTVPLPPRQIRSKPVSSDVDQLRGVSR
jgi:hypothetical protein